MNVVVDQSCLYAAVWAIYQWLVWSKYILTQNNGSEDETDIKRCGELEQLENAHWRYRGLLLRGALWRYRELLLPGALWRHSGLRGAQQPLFQCSNPAELWLLPLFCYCSNNGEFSLSVFHRCSWCHLSMILCVLKIKVSVIVPLFLIRFRKNVKGISSCIFLRIQLYCV